MFTSLSYRSIVNPFPFKCLHTRTIYRDNKDEPVTNIEQGGCLYRKYLVSIASNIFFDIDIFLFFFIYLRFANDAPSYVPFSLISSIQFAFVRFAGLFFFAVDEGIFSSRYSARARRRTEGVCCDSNRKETRDKYDTDTRG